MSEEMNRREAELNERELSGVSGGDGSSLNAGLTCGFCDHRRSCGPRTLDLARYLKEHELRSTINYQSCPFYNDAGKAGKS